MRPPRAGLRFVGTENNIVLYASRRKETFVTLDDFDLAPGISLSDAARTIEECAAAETLRVTLRETLSQYPGSLHWHWKRGREIGILEITLLNRERRIQLSVQAGRVGTWTTETMERMSEILPVSYTHLTLPTKRIV